MLRGSWGCTAGCPKCFCVALSPQTEHPCMQQFCAELRQLHAHQVEVLTAVPTLPWLRVVSFCRQCCLGTHGRKELPAAPSSPPSPHTQVWGGCRRDGGRFALAGICLLKPKSLLWRVLPFLPPPQGRDAVQEAALGPHTSWCPFVVGVDPFCCSVAGDASSLCEQQ